MNEIKLPNNSTTKSGISVLMKKYWDVNAASHSQSSFWQHYSSLAEIDFDQNSGVLKFKGTMFGDYKPSSSSGLYRLLPANLITGFKANKLIRPIKETLLNVCKRHKREITFDCLKQALSIQEIVQNGVDLRNKRICVIGDGYGFLGCFLKSLEPSAKIVSVNLGKISIFDISLTSFGFPELDINLAKTSQDYLPHMDFNFIPAEIIHECEIDDIDVFLNIASMQEMTNTTIQNYLHWMRAQKTQSTYFYCCNRVSKILPDGEVVKFNNYGWKDTDTILIDELCKWYKSAPINRPPFFLKFDGPVWHRLTILK